MLYDLAKRGHIDLTTGKRTNTLTPDVQKDVASSLLVCIGDIFVAMVRRLLKAHPELKAISFVGGVACNKYLQQRLKEFCDRQHIMLAVAPPAFCTDNGAMIAYVGSYYHSQGVSAPLHTDIFE